MVHYIEPADLAEAEYDDLHPHTAPTVAAQQCGREPDAYEVRCTDGNYEWRRPYHGELEVIMSTGRVRSGKPFEYRALYATVPLSTVTPAEVGGVAIEDMLDRFERAAFAATANLPRGKAARQMESKSRSIEYNSARDAIRTALEAQAAELAACPDWPTVNATYEKWRARADAAEAERDEMRKALDAIASLDDNSLHYGPEFARRALTGGQEE